MQVWGVAYFTVYNSQDAGYLTKHLTNASAPRLKELSVRTAGYNTCMDLFRGGAERLEELVLSGVFMPWTFTSLPHLRILRLSKLKSKAAVTTGGFVKLLLKCPNLTKLEIQDCEISESNTSDLPDHLELAHLRHLDFSRNTPPVSAYSILSRIHSPRFEHFHFRSRSFISLTDNALRNLSHFAPSLVNLVASARKLFFHLRRTAYDFGTYSGLPTGLRYWPFQLYRWHDGAEAPSALVEWVTAHFGDAMKDIKTHVEIHNLSLSQRDLAAIGTIPFVVSLDLDGSGDQTLPVLRLLSTRTLINGRQSWTFPRLAKLSIKGKSLNLDATLNMVESRYGHNLASEEVGLNAQLPTPFTELNIGTEDRTCVDPSMIDRISGIVGKDQLHWSVNRRGYGEEDSDS
ncbi:hypothetical protein FRB99_005272 [Tulasnella sp. 403]|nr:hypothetical protein FRB99_005272 [Tulasnella sp. 403]